MAQSKGKPTIILEYIHWIRTIISQCSPFAIPLDRCQCLDSGIPMSANGLVPLDLIVGGGAKQNRGTRTGGDGIQQYAWCEVSCISPCNSQLLRESHQTTFCALFLDSVIDQIVLHREELTVTLHRRTHTLFDLKT